MFKTIKFSEDAKAIIKLINTTKEHLFITGKAGTGKSTLLKHIYEQDPSIIVLAPTGIAAINVNGDTIHSFFKLKPRYELDEAKHVRINEKMMAKYIHIHTIIIDEISMVRAPMLDAISETLKLHRDSSEPFGGVHVLACGDLFQLPPVVKDQEEEAIYEKYESIYFFSANSFKEIVSPSFYELTYSFRQSDDNNFYDLLNNIRLGNDLENTINKINASCFNPSNYEESALIVTSRRYRADQINEEMLNTIEGPATAAMAEELGDLNENELPAPRNLRIKEGAKVMFIKNDSEGRWVNGTVGKVVDCKDKKRKTIKVEVAGKTLNVKREEWNKIRYVYDDYDDEMEEEIVSSFKQFPLKLGWAVTIHKAQGLTLESCSIDLGQGAFATGQTYVALSRCKTLGSVNLYQELRKTDAMVDSAIVDFHKKSF